MSTHQALTPFARKLAETMCRTEFKDEPAPKRVEMLPLTEEQRDDARAAIKRLVAKHGWTQKDHEAILDRPRAVEP